MSIFTLCKKLFLSHKLLNAIYGGSISLYFDFIVLMLIFNMILGLVQSIPHILHLIIDINDNHILRYILTSTYSPSILLIWRIANGICICLSMLFPLLYIIYGRITQPNICPITALDHNDDIIKDNIDVISRVPYMILSYTIFTMILLLSIVINSGVAFVQNYDPITKYMSEHLSIYGQYTIFSIILGCILNIMNWIWDKVQNKLIDYEKHRTYTSKRNSHIMKVVLFRMLNSWSAILVNIVLIDTCVLELLGIQVLSLIILELMIFNILEILFPVIRLCFQKWRNKPIKLAEFNITEEYYEIIYRQYIIYIGMSAFPWITFLGAITCFFELIVDKIKLTMLTDTIIRERANINTIAICMSICAILACINPTSGNIYLLVGNIICTGNCTTCSIYR